MSLAKQFGLVALRTLTRVLFRIEVRGNPRVFSSKLLIIANHESFLDGLLLAVSLPQHPLFVVHTGVSRSLFFRILLKAVDYLAVDPTSPMAMKTVIRVIESGRPVVIFPEGRITTTGSLMKTYDGPAFVAAKTGATILPVRIDGAARTYFSRLSGKHPHHLLPRITINVQPTTRIEMPKAATARERRRIAGEAMRRLMQEMIFASRPRQTLYEALLSALSIHGRSWRLVEDIKQIEYSYGDLLKMTLALGRLVSRKCVEGERVGVLLPNLAPTLGLIFGLSAFRRVPALMNYTSGAEGMIAACEAATIKRIVTSRAFIEQGKLEDKIAILAQTRQIIYLEDLRAEMTGWDKAWLILWALRFPGLAVPSGDAEDPAAVLFTSGSEGKPKGVVLSHRALLANIQQARAVVDFSSEDKLLNALPLFHSFGLTVGGLLPVISGANVFLYTSPLHYRVIPELVYDRNCTILLGTSTFLSNYAKHAHPYDFYRLRYVIAGAEKLTNTVRTNWFEKFGIRILEGYGATECAPVLAVNTRMAYRTGSVGQLLPGMQARLVPVPGVDVGGALHVSGPNVMSGYLRSENPGVLEPPSSEVGPGWYSTGDIVDIDADGYLYIVGRIKRFAKIAGEMISLESVERLATQASDKGTHAATSQPDATRGENILLYTTDKTLARDQLQAAARAGGWPEIAVPRKIIVVDELPVLGSGKTDYVTLKQWAETA
ncbi:bifunctional acyl-ACP--phospholipid O-acyltransferase/long-chain-fatty-acid--ACP ligase [Uliginosibacterium sp. 31-16]|uniref:bifunctional acyl-ACP--phospholipid O-acyltransferase/long-chain-fatty-acid--ACP ligase n=1 Tax=Uliginosibacterium sp. 31-16 TaxID=3068315 RepID=UPI00273F48DE|nr:bifunctional acyl-ACP--phospholipid O-acyltransferase/long-chain-fatty-acid--ACP ligase [Uliginosibacterium sp. 31-16]MDP5238829.1 bifunctional acyl-ACP--phospholipid O-acyltransferase/long-chain-fatty-acid--ACP ligase [Uliginosibacterium sp. 31-16]